jgi:sec-independent protein translocase protein TatB
MFNIGTGELLVIGLVALIVLGPDKLPQAARQLGRFTSEARKIANGFRQEMHDAMNEVAETADTSEPVDDRVADHRLAAAPTDAEPVDRVPAEARPLTPPAGPSPTAASSNEDWPPSASPANGTALHDSSSGRTDTTGPAASGPDDQAPS